jgi:predicted Zn-dependent protease
MIAGGMGAFRQTPLRMLAPLALAAFAVVFLIVIVASLDNGSPSREPDRRATRGGQAETTAAPRRSGGASERRVYVVKPGDTLAQIAIRTDVPVERLLTLNPMIDPQGLVTGQRIKLRE